MTARKVESLQMLMQREQQQKNLLQLAASSNSGSNVGHFQAVSFSFGNGGRTFTQTNGDVDAGVFQVARLGMALGTVTDDGNFLALDDRQVAVFFVINFHEIPLYPGR